MTSEAPISMRDRLREDYGWTPRQRQVLDLMARGKTNTEIAEALGISLAGAKWHVSEILSKLHSDSREEAAEYWRHYNGLAPRFARVFRGLVLPSGLRWAAGAAVAVGAGLVLVLVAFSLGGDDQQATPDRTPQVTTTAEASATQDATSTPDAGPQILGERDGLPIFELVPADPVSLPEGSVLYYAEGCIPCIDLTLYRFFEDEASGEWKAERVLGKMHPGLPPGYPLIGVISDGGKRLAVRWCLETPADCGKQHDGSANDARIGLVVSEDGGATWDFVSELPPTALLQGFTDDGIAFSTYEDDPSDQEPGADVYQVYPTGRQLTTEEGEELGRAIRTAEGWNVAVATDADEPVRLANEPSVFITVWPDGHAPQEFYAFPGGSLLLVQGYSPTLFLAVAQRSEKSSHPGQSHAGFDPRAPVVVNLETGTLSEIIGLRPENDTTSLGPVALILPSGGTGGQ